MIAAKAAAIFKNDGSVNNDIYNQMDDDTNIRQEQQEIITPLTGSESGISGTAIPDESNSLYRASTVQINHHVRGEKRPRPILE